MLFLKKKLVLYDIISIGEVCMKKLNIIFIILLVLILVVGCDNEHKQNGSELLVGKSNDSSSNLQAKVIIEKINIRKDATTSSEKIGIVEKGSLFDVIDYETDDYYIWLHIKTDNNIEGYIATERKNPYVEFINGTIDVEKPILELLNNSIEVENRASLTEDVIKNNIRYSDDSGEAIITFSVDYEDTKTFGKNQYVLKIKVADKSGNVIEKQTKVKFTNERKISNGSWITYDEALKIRKKLNNICNKYGEAITDDVCWGDTWKLTYSGYLQIFTDRNWFKECTYDVNDNFKPQGCFDGVGSVEYSLYESNIKAQENKNLPKAKAIKSEFEALGYKFEDIQWN